MPFLKNWDCQPLDSLWPFNAVSVDKAILRELDIIKKYKDITPRPFIKKSKPRYEIWLVNTKYHFSPVKE